MIWQGLPCLIIGTTDIIKQFHPYGFAVCSNEKEEGFKFIFMCIRDCLHDLNLKMNEQELVLIAHGSDAIRNAFSDVFGPVHSMAMCWYHMRERVVKKLCLIEDKDDIDILQLSKNKTTFDMAVKLFLKKWKSQERFLDYFSDEWLESKSGWYEGLEVNVPNTNNALEATNRFIKDEDTTRGRLSLSRFTVVVFQ